MNSTISDLLLEYRDLPEFGHLDSVSVNTVGSFGVQPIHVAAVRGDLSAIALLAENGADLNARGEHGYSPLHEATEQGHLPAVELLIELGARLNSKNDDGEMPLAIAKSLGYEHLVKTLQPRIEQ